MEVRLNQKEFNYKMATGTLNLFLAENKIDPTKPTEKVRDIKTGDIIITGEKIPKPKKKPKEDEVE